MKASDIKERAYQLGMEMCGIADAARLSNAPHGSRPEDILPGCRSVITIGTALLKGAVQANYRAFEDGRDDLKGIYGAYAYSTFPNFSLAYSCYAMAKFIEGQTMFVATPCSTGPMMNGRHISIRHCAVASGLGEFGWMSIVLSPQYGPRNRFGVILTTMEIEPDPMYEGPVLCSPEKCGICARVCPNDALSKYGEVPARAVLIGEREYSYCHVSIPRCHTVMMKLRKRFGGSEDFIGTDDPTREEVGAGMALARNLDDRGLQHTASYHCGRCLSYCPAGGWSEAFRETGLSRGFKADRMYTE